MELVEEQELPETFELGRGVVLGELRRKAAKQFRVPKEELAEAVALLHRRLARVGSPVHFEVKLADPDGQVAAAGLGHPEELRSALAELNLGKQRRVRGASEKLEVPLGRSPSPIAEAEHVQ
ncbi:MAG: hypothetical protein UZ18_ATM001002445 [Armatimonadetes bacterium OLB18]|nr:MAG: hypothetical protein UZ18_ATM001002445 [Armatimonadetes bacterium OLB18]